MKNISSKFSEDLLFTNETGKYLYEKYAKEMPIIDYHCHLQPQKIYENKEFVDIGEIWLSGDHYKWRAMREFGIEEKYITGDETSYHEKYLAFASILPKLVGNPLFIWCALELKRFFDIDDPVTSKNAEEIYQKTSDLIRKNHITPQWCMEKSNVKVVSTTEDPIDDLKFHLLLAKEHHCPVKVISAFRPDKAMFCERDSFPSYVEKLSQVSGHTIQSFSDLMKALEIRLAFFKTIGTMISDDGIPSFKWENASDEEISGIFGKALRNEPLDKREIDQYRSRFLFEMGCLYHQYGFVMQLHVGTYLDANSKGVKEVGQSCGFDCADDKTSVSDVGELLNRLTLVDRLPKTILYSLDIAEMEAFGILAGGFCASGTKGKVQIGAPWWFHDQVYGINHQFESVANLYPLSLSLGMLTDSRSFFSYPRHELYRRVLCNYLGMLCERKEYIGTEENLGEIIKDICYRNVGEYFGLKESEA
jgi:glucuronate isomerase